MHPSRRHDIDALRVLAFGLLILYHLAMFYVAEWGWHIKSVHVADWLQWPMLAVNRWRMELLFLISGLALSLLLGRDGAHPWRLARQRTWRLLLPLAFGMAVVVPIQPYAEALGKGKIEPGFADFLFRYGSGQGFPPDSFGGWEHGWTWNHLWYLAYLWVYTLLLIALRPLLDRGAGTFRRLRGSALLTLPAIPFVLWAWALQGRFPSTNDLVSDWFMHGIYALSLLYGYWLGTDTGLWRELARLRRHSLGWALGLFLPYLLILELLADEPPLWQLQCARLLRWSYMWLALCAVLGWAHAHLNRPFPGLRYASEAVYPWYVLHQSLIVALGFWLAPRALGPVAEPALILLGTVGGCALLYHGLIRRSRLLRPLFGLSTQPPSGRGRSLAENPDQPSPGKAAPASSLLEVPAKPIEELRS